jgi:hypothetical protein
MSCCDGFVFVDESAKQVASAHGLGWRNVLGARAPGWIGIGPPRPAASLVADDDEALVALELSIALRGVSSLDPSLASQAIPLVERDLHLGRVSQGTRLAARAFAADRKE